MREAGRLSGIAVLEAMRSTAPGVMEYELSALAEFVFHRGGAFGVAYEPIVAAGDNIWHGHYGAKRSRLETGQLVLMDTAPDYRYYTSDIGRMWPVDGRWEPWQLELYGFIARYHVELLSRIRPGVTSTDVLAGAAEVMESVVEQTNFSKPAYERAAREAIEFPYHLSHPVGMSVHDVGEYRGRPLRPRARLLGRPDALGPRRAALHSLRGHGGGHRGRHGKPHGLRTHRSCRDRARDERAGAPAVVRRLMSAGEPRLWFKSPAPTWLAALPIGNGRLGATIFGRVYKETLIFNEETSGPVGPTIATTRSAPGAARGASASSRRAHRASPHSR